MLNTLKISSFPRHLLTGSHSDDELREIYRGTDAEIGFRGEELRYFLGLFRDSIDRGL